MNEILQKSPTEICKHILKMLNNETVNIEIDKNSNSSLYVFLQNTIYISNKVSKRKNKEDQNKAKLLVISHECAHSIQPKFLQLLNFILSNLEMILFIAIILLRIFTKCNLNILTITYVAVFAISVLIRLYLEMNATINSVKIACKYLLINGIQKSEVNNIYKYYKKELLKTLPAFITYLFLLKIIRFIIVVIV